MFRYALLLGVVVILASTPVRAQPKAPADDKPAADKAADKPADKPADAKADDKDAPKGEALKVTIKSVSGIAEKRSAADAKGKWTPIKVGDVLDELTLVRTGMGNSKVVLEFSDRGDVTVKRCTKMGIAELRKQGKLVKARFGLKYGAIRTRVDSTKGANDIRIRTAVGTMAAKGSISTTAVWGDFSFQFTSSQGSWQGNIANKVASVVAGEWANKDLDTPSIDIVLDQTTPQIFDPHGGATTAEVKNIVINGAGAGRGIIGFTGSTNSTATPRLTNDTPPPVPDLPPAFTNEQLRGPTGGIEDPEYTYP